MAFLKVKRKLAQDPTEVFVLECKKNKPNEPDDKAPIFELTETVTSEQDIDKAINRTLVNRQTAPKKRKIDVDKIRDRMRKENMLRARDMKSKMLSGIRQIEETTVEKNTVPVIDVNVNESVKDDDAKYVYDLYFSEHCIDLKDSDFLSNYYVREIDDEWWSEENEEEEVAEDDDDSNDENNWRNDYPDEESDDSDADSDGNDLSRRMKRIYVSSDVSSCGESEGTDYYDEVLSVIDSESDN